MSYANDLALLAEVSSRVVNTKQQISEAIAIGERVLVRFHAVRDNLEDLQLRADELAKRFRPAT